MGGGGWVGGGCITVLPSGDLIKLDLKPCSSVLKPITYNVCVCVRACTCVRVRACVRACVCVCV